MHVASTAPGSWQVPLLHASDGWHWSALGLHAALTAPRAVQMFDELQNADSTHVCGVVDGVTGAHELDVAAYARHLPA